MKLRLAIVVLLATGFACGDERMPVVADPTVKQDTVSKPPLELIDISKVPPLDPKARFQKGKTSTSTVNQVAKDLVSNGKSSIPFLIAKLDDETEMDPTIMNFWYQLYVGDTAHIILTDFFTDRRTMKSTVPGFGWDEFLEKDRDEKMTGEEALRQYIRKHGRKDIRRRWQEMWDKNKEKIIWDEACECFRPKA